MENDLRMAARVQQASLPPRDTEVGSLRLAHVFLPCDDRRSKAPCSAGNSETRRRRPPARVAERLNRQFPMDRSRQYFTLVYGVVDPRSGDVRYVIAGHS